MPDQPPTQTLHAAADALRDPDADACQHPSCGCPDELHRRDADGATWCKDCQDQHAFKPRPVSAVPEQLREPLADWLERAASSWEALEYASRQALDPTDPGHVRAAAILASGPYDASEAVAVARQILGSSS